MYHHYNHRLLLIRGVVTLSRATASHTGFPGNHRDIEPPDSIPNSEVKSVIADDSVGLPHVKVGHCQDLNRKPCYREICDRAFFMPGVFTLVLFC